MATHICIHILHNTSLGRAVGEKKPRTVTTRRERPVREVDANEFDRKSSPLGSSLSISKSSREVNLRTRKRELRAIYPRCLCHSGDNPIAKSIGNPRECLPLGNREVKLIVSCLSFYKVILAFTRLSRNRDIKYES